MLSLKRVLQFRPILNFHAKAFTTTLQPNLQTLPSEGLVITPLNDAIGGLVHNVDLSKELTTEVFDAIHSAWLHHSVLCFRQQKLSDAALVRFSKRLGELDSSPSSEVHTKGTKQIGSEFPEVWVISNVKENGVPIGSLGDGEAFWHTDLSYVDLPPKASLLYSLEVPPVSAGGCTSWLNMYTALEELPAELRKMVEDKWAKHPSSYTSAAELRVGAEDVKDIRSAPGAFHPMIITHPETGKDALYLGRRLHSSIKGMDMKESDELLDQVWEHTTQKKYVYTHEWDVGDLLMWDNRCTMHQRDSFSAQYRRVMHRTQIKSTLPLH